MEIETLISIFTVDKGDLKILLVKKQTDPYKGYWVLPGDNLKEESLDDNITNVVIEKVGLNNLWLEQYYTFSNIQQNNENKMISVGYMGVIDSVSIELKMEKTDVEKEWFKVNELPKLAYDHDKIILKSVNNLRNKITNINILKLLFPSDFTLPELQNLYENLLNKDFDRRNFRKKFINLNLIKETGDKTEGVTGRPAKLYTFKDEIKDKILF